MSPSPMAILTPSTGPTGPSQRFVQGNLVTRYYNLAGNNGDTFTVAGMGQPIFIDLLPTTAVAMGATIAGNTITFITGGAWAALVGVTARYG